MKKCERCVCKECPKGCQNCHSKKSEKCFQRKCQDEKYKYRNSIFYKIGKLIS